MVPTDYRLERVSLRMIERLEGARRSFPADRAPEEFHRMAVEIVDAALGEYGTVAVEDPAPHAAFLRQEAIETFLPRYTKVGIDMTAREDTGFGLRFFANPAGRVALAALALAIAYVEFRAGGVRLGLTGVALFVTLPFLPDLLRMLWRRRHQRNLQDIVDDMARIQAQADAYTPVDRLQTEPIRETTAERPRPTPLKEH